MGYTNKDLRVVNVTRAEKKVVSRAARRALAPRCSTKSTPRKTIRETKRGHYYA
jgi:hypothetical protein